MSIRSVVGGVAALGVAILTGTATASSSPDLLSASARHGHVAVTFTLGADEAPGRLVVASASAAGRPFTPASIRVNEQLQATRYRSGYRAVTRRALGPGRYEVEISAVAVGVDCLPLKPCAQSWSNVRSVTLRPSR